MIKKKKKIVNNKVYFEQKKEGKKNISNIKIRSLHRASFLWIFSLCIKYVNQIHTDKWIIIHSFCNSSSFKFNFNEIEFIKALINGFSFSSCLSPILSGIFTVFRYL